MLGHIRSVRSSVRDKKRPIAVNVTGTATIFEAPAGMASSGRALLIGLCLWRQRP